MGNYTAQFWTIKPKIIRSKDYHFWSLGQTSDNCKNSLISHKPDRYFTSEINLGNLGRIKDGDPVQSTGESRFIQTIRKFQERDEYLEGGRTKI